LLILQSERLTLELRAQIVIVQGSPVGSILQWSRIVYTADALEAALLRRAVVESRALQTFRNLGRIEAATEAEKQNHRA
jgi:hypothetical protein